MENVLRKYGWAMTLACLMLACLLLAWNINSLIASKLARYTVPSLPDLRKQVAQDTKASPARAAQGSPADMANAIDKRCLFGCAEPVASKGCAAGCPEGQICQEDQCVDSPVAAQGAEEIDTSIPIPSTLSAKLIGVMVASPERYSSALLKSTTDQQTIILHMGDLLLGEGELVQVQRDRVVLQRAGRLEFIKLEGTHTASQPQASNRPISRPPIPSPALNTTGPQATGPSPAPSRKDVVEIAPNTYQVDRKSLDAALNDTGALAQGASLIPNYKDGKRNGLKLMGISPDSIYQRLGLQSGDVVSRINGQEIKSQAHALELLQSFRESSDVAIEMERRGRREKLKYNVK